MDVGCMWDYGKYIECKYIDICKNSKSNVCMGCKHNTMERTYDGLQVVQKYIDKIERKEEGRE